MHTSCAPNKPAAHELPALDGWKEMSREAKAMALEAAGATGAVASEVVGDDVELKPQVSADEDDDSDGDALYVD